MKKFNVKFLHEYTVQIEADNAAEAERRARRIFGLTVLQSVTAENYVEKPCVGCEEDGPIKPKPTGGPSLGGSPGTPVVRTEQLVDQIASAA